MKSALTIKTILKLSIWLAPILAILLSGCITGHDVKYPHGQSPTKRAEFMLSFDDGPLPYTTGRVLNILATIKTIDGAPIKAGFFLLADPPDEFWQRRIYYAPYEFWTGKGSITKYPKVARRIKQDGHIIGNHTTHHAWFQWPWLDTPEAVLGEFIEWEAIAKPVLGVSETKLFRPPYMVITKNVRETAKRLGYRIIMGEPVGDTIPGITVNEIKQKTQSILAAWNKPYPCVLIFHDIRPATYEHLDEIVGNLQQQGFRLVDFDPKRL